MRQRIRNYFRRWKEPEPELYDVPSMEGQAMSFEFITATHTGVNTELPRIGDVIIHLVSCSMGVTVLRDTRERVINYEEYPGVGTYVRTKLVEDGQYSKQWVAGLRKLVEHPRFWVIVK